MSDLPMGYAMLMAVADGTDKLLQGKTVFSTCIRIQ